MLWKDTGTFITVGEQCEHQTRRNLITVTKPRCTVYGNCVCVHQAPLSTGFFRQEHWSGLPFPLPGDLPNSGIEPMSPVSPALAGRFFITESPGNPIWKLRE